MTLHKRLILTTLAMAVPLVIAVVILSRIFGLRTNDSLITALMLAHFSPATLDACEVLPPSAPMTITIPVPPFRTPDGPAIIKVYTYDSAGRSHQALAPRLPPSLFEADEGWGARSGHSVEVAFEGTDHRLTRHLLMALPRENGPCAFALAVAPNLFPLGPPPGVLLIPIALALITVLVGIWPVVRRIRAMTLAVRRWNDNSPLGLPRDVAGDELSELARALSESAETIRNQHASIVSREKALHEFIGNTTHDLATPLTVLQGNLSALAKEHSPKAVRQAMNEAQYLGALLGNLALSAKFETGALIETSLDLCDAVSRVVDRHRSMALRLDVSIECSVPGECVHTRGDPTFTERALSNLVDNALRHNARGGHVAVVLEIEGDEFVLRVLDDGPGLTAEECERVMRRGERGDTARTRGSAGSGLGLSIVARAAQLQSWCFTLSPGEPVGLVAELRGRLE